MTERSLDEYPDFGTDDPLPWDEDYASVAICPFSNLRSFGQPLQSLKSAQLLAIRREAETRNGRIGHYFDALVGAIDEMLQERGGEL